jgi:hypothetical protein
MNIGGIDVHTPGDIIVVGAGFAAGFAVDAFFFSGGVTASETGAATAMAALSSKYAVQKFILSNDNENDSGGDRQPTDISGDQSEVPDKKEAENT